MESAFQKKMASAALILIGVTLLVSMMYGFAAEGIPALGMVLETIGQGLNNIRG